jgi:hypothetical protein
MNNKYNYLIVTEGKSDIKILKDSFSVIDLNIDEFFFLNSRGKNQVCNSTTWNEIHHEKTDLTKRLIFDCGRSGFKCVILLIDSDDDEPDQAFNSYHRNTCLNYINDYPPQKTNKGCYWHIDSLRGPIEIPIYGIAVPVSNYGNIETELLMSYGFPADGQTEYCQLENIIKKASDEWGVPLKGDGKKWWEVNKKSKIDKFIYSALSHGFEVSVDKDKRPRSPKVPKVIECIKEAIDSLTN